MKQDIISGLSLVSNMDASFTNHVFDVKQINDDTQVLEEKQTTVKVGSNDFICKYRVLYFK